VRVVRAMFNDAISDGIHPGPNPFANLRLEQSRGRKDLIALTRHFCATHLLELGVSHADVAVQLGHTDGGALVMSTYGHPSEDAARARLRLRFFLVSSLSHGRQVEW
jgi:hypothetical protein